MKDAFEASITGSVQGVFFREYTRRFAQTLSIVGEAENMTDGSVRVYAEGEKRNLERFIEFLQRGSPDARVDNVAFTWVQPTGEHVSFAIVHS